MSNLIKRAADYSRKHHEGQFRKYTGEPYFIHPESVANIVASVGGSEEMQAAAYMHDLVEDTDVTIEDIHNRFPKTVASYVLWLTDVSHPLHGNRSIRKHLDCKMMSLAPDEVKTIKISDIIDNSRSIKVHDLNFWNSVYKKEKLRLIETALIGGNEELMNIAKELCND